MGLDPCNCSLRIQESTVTSTPKMGAHLGVWGFILSHSLALPGAWNVTPGLHTWPAPLQALTLVMSPRLRLQQWTFMWSSSEVENFNKDFFFSFWFLCYNFLHNIFIFYFPFFITTIFMQILYFPTYIFH